jgi:hypothetical protein
MTDVPYLQELSYGVTTRLDPEFRTSGGALELEDFIQTFSREIDLRPLNTVVDEVMERFTRSESASSDAWLGPRLHHVLRLERHEAARRGPWLYLAIAARPDYVIWRFGDPDKPEEAVGVERFAGPDYKHAFARLWWMTELFRNGSDYRTAELALGNQDITNNLFRMDVAHHRPTALGAVAVLFPDGERPRTGRAANALAKAVNAAATTLQLDAIVLDGGPDEAAAKAWIESARDVDALTILDELPSGPDDPPVAGDDTDRMADLLSSLLAEAHIRGEDRDAPEEAEATSPEEVVAV